MHFVKRCPVCRREFTDEYTFCDQDGASLIEAAPQPNARLIVRAADGTQSETALTAAPATIGKAPDNTIVLKDGAASRRHAQIEWQADHYVVKDLGSLNGVFVNGERISSQVLRDGDEILIGRYRLHFADLTLAATALTSAERWRNDGWFRRSALNALCLAAYLAGAPPKLVARIYCRR